MFSCYQGMQFHVHRQVMASHCPGLLAYPSPSRPSQGPPSKRRRKSKHTCPLHCSSSQGCVQLPEPVSPHVTLDYEELYLFFKHIYYPHLYYIPPFVPASMASPYYVEDWDMQGLPFPTFPKPGPFSPLGPLPSSHLLSSAVAPGDPDRAVHIYEGVPELARFLGAKGVLARCEEVMRRRLRQVGVKGEAWVYLVVSARCGMEGLKRRCMELVTKEGRGEEEGNGREEGVEREEEEGWEGEDGAWVDNWRELEGTNALDKDMLLDLLEMGMQRMLAETRR